MAEERSKTYGSGSSKIGIKIGILIVCSSTGIVNMYCKASFGP
jgi:hypothetical protein